MSGRSGLGAFVVVACGTVAAILALLFLGVSLGSHARSELLAARASMLQGVVDELVREGVLPIDSKDPNAMTVLDEAVRLRLLGGEIVRVKLWAPDGTVIYSDGQGLTGERFPMSEDLTEAFEGTPGYERASTDAAENTLERGWGDLLEFYLPVKDAGGQIPAAFEVYQSTTNFDASLDEVAKDVRTFLLAGIGALLLIAAAAWRLHTRALDRRRGDAERALGDALAQADRERRLMVGTLHDDVGQPMFRLLYGIEGAAAQLPDSPARDELGRLSILVHDIDRELRAALRGLHTEVVDAADIPRRLAELGDETQRETGMLVEVHGDFSPRLDPMAAAALFRTAREALHNVRKHAGARSVRVTLEQDESLARVIVADDGRGWDGRMGLGLTTTSERLDAVGGRLQVRRRLGRGTRVTAEVPVKRSIT
jgi:signal transduction histidine kinase